MILRRYHRDHLDLDLTMHAPTLVQKLQVAILTCCNLTVNKFIMAM